MTAPFTRCLRFLTLSFAILFSLVALHTLRTLALEEPEL